MRQGFVPKIGRQFGFLYPIAHRVLSLTWWPSFYRLAKGNRIVVDLYVIAWFLGEMVVAVLLFTGWVVFTLTIVVILVILLIYRICDMLLVVLYSLTRSAYKQDADWASRNRTVILSFINLFEVFLIFALLYSVLPRGSFNRDISLNMMDCLYFSVVAGITLGLGDIYPIAITAKVLCMIQPIIILTVLLTMISYARGSHADKTYEEKQIEDMQKNNDQPE